MKLALRALRRSPGFIATYVFIVGVAISINTGVFSVVNAVIFRPLPVRAPGELGFVYATNPQNAPLIYRDFLSLQSHRDIFASAAAISLDRARLGNGLEEEWVPGEAVSPSYFDTLGAIPVIGRALQPSDDLPTSDPAVVISDRLWRHRFAADPSVLGQSVALDWPHSAVSGRRYTIVGVMSPRFVGLVSVWTPTDYWVPFAQRGIDRRTAEASERAPSLQDLPGSLGVTTLVVRRAAGTSTDLASAFVRAQHSEALRQKGLNSNSRTAFLLERRPRAHLPFVAARELDTVRIAIALQLVGFSVVLIATANLAGLQLVRGMARRKDVAVLLAMGATRSRIARQLSTESLLLSLLGGGVGLFLSKGLVRIFLRSLPDQFGGGQYTAAHALSLDVPLDWRVLVLTGAVCLGVGLLTAFVPMRAAFKTSLTDELSGQMSAHLARSGRRRTVVIAQVSLSVVLLVLAAVSTRTFLNTTRDPGYDPQRAVAVTYSYNAPSRTMSAEDEGIFFDRRDRFHRALLEGMKTQPEVSAVALSLGVPVFSNMWAWIVSRDRFPGGAAVNVSRAVVTADYFRSLGISVLRGRTFDDRDSPTSPKVVVVCERLAAQLWPRADPIGKFIAVRAPASTAPPKWMEVVGVVHALDLPLSDESPTTWVYTSLDQDVHPNPVTLIVRTDGNQAEMIQSMRRIVLATDSNARVVNASSFADKISEIVYPRRIATATLSAAAALGVLLASLGLFGLMSYVVEERRHELSIRTALGADRYNLVSLVLTEGVKVATIGSGIGALLAFITVRVVSATIIRFSSPDAAALVALTMILAMAILMACYIPARRAAAIDPIDALRRL